MNPPVDYYNASPRKFGEREFLKQVGHTLHGQAISTEQFEIMVHQLEELLELGPEDQLLDLCCGNGLITQRLATQVAGVAGIDLSNALIDVARTYHQPENTEYWVANVLALGNTPNLSGRGFTRAVMHTALQHFKLNDLRQILQTVFIFGNRQTRLLISYIPDKSKWGLFYNTPRRRFDWLVRKALGTEMLGTWWSREFIASTCHDLDLKAQFIELDKRLEASRYRFSVVIHAADCRKSH